uniref:Uncharacterized protein n=1 Tax=Macaca fascicularis TaxID=9541 RepID=A0A7N9CHD4_MACFA
CQCLDLRLFSLQNWMHCVQKCLCRKSCRVHRHMNQVIYICVL